MTEPFVSIILRSFNEGWALRETLPAIRAQAYQNWELIVIDSGSTDGSVELIQKAHPRHFIQIQPGTYNPSRVMNLGMQLARSEFGIFLNADATPQGDGWLRPLVMALQDGQVAAAFGKQIPRPDCRAVYAHDYERCFGPRRESARWDHFFSMASSGIRKNIWAQRGFLEQMQYSEDDEYTRWCRQHGYRIVYVSESVVMHSHNYTPRQAYRRSFGEARALAAVWTGRPGAINWPRTVLLGWLNDARRDLGFCARRNCLREWPNAARIRWEQRRAKLAGFREGWRFYRNGNGLGAPGSPGAAKWSEDDSPARFKSVDTVQESIASARESRFTIDGSDSLENHLSKICTEVLAGVRSLIQEQKLEALVLGGGYGRGQGGVLHSAASDQPYNDLEFYVFLHGSRLINERIYGEALCELGERLSPTAGLHIEFKIDSLARLRRSLVTMFSYDLVSGHKVLWCGKEKRSTSNVQRSTFNSAPASYLQVERWKLNDERSSPFTGCEHHLDATAIPLEEATRLLFNRCTGLLFAKAYLRAGSLSAEQEDFIGRNLAKAQLALGDAVLVAFGEYHWNCFERHRRLQQLGEDWSFRLDRGSATRSDSADAFAPESSNTFRHAKLLRVADPRSNRRPALQSPSWFPDVLRHHAAGVAFKLHPRRISKPIAEFQREHREIANLALEVWLWLENRRLNRQYPSAHEYAFSPAKKCFDTPAWRNLLLNARSFGPKSIFDGLATRYPRERLLNSLPLLLCDEPLNDLRVRRFLQNQLRTAASDWQSFVAAYRSVWPRYS